MPLRLRQNAAVRPVMPPPMIATDFLSPAAIKSRLFASEEPAKMLFLKFGSEAAKRLNRPRVFALAHRRQCIIEAHRDVTDKETPGIGHLKAGRGAAHQAIGFVRRERFELALEMRGKIYAEFLRHRGIIERKIA